jgi:hypothetical protein
MIRPPPIYTPLYSSAASFVYKRQAMEARRRARRAGEPADHGNQARTARTAQAWSRGCPLRIGGARPQSITTFRGVPVRWIRIPPWAHPWYPAGEPVPGRYRLASLSSVRSRAAEGRRTTVRVASAAVALRAGRGNQRVRSLGRSALAAVIEGEGSAAALVVGRILDAYRPTSGPQRRRRRTLLPHRPNHTPRPANARTERTRNSPQASTRRSATRYRGGPAVARPHASRGERGRRGRGGPWCPARARARGGPRCRST